MTLHMLLVAIAVGTPFAGVVIEASRLGVVGSLVGLCFAMAFGVVQFRGHDRLLDMILRKSSDGWNASLLLFVGLYYVSIPVVGGLCHVLTICVARHVVGWVRF